MAKVARYPEYDWARIGQNARRMRIGQGISQEELAERAGVSLATVYNVERCVPVSRRTLLKVCAGLNEPLDSLRTRNQSVLTEERDYMVFRGENPAWIVFGETRTWVPADDVARIQNPEERMRLGRLGFVPLFAHTTNFIMPEGPGMVKIELYGRYGDTFNATVYRDCLVECVEGRLRSRIGESTVEIGPGDVIGYRTKDLAWMEPVEGEDLPVRLTWTGAIRVGSPVHEVAHGARVKRRDKLKFIS